MRDDLFVQEAALQSSIVDAHATVAATQRLFSLAEDEEVLRFHNYASYLGAPGRVASPDAAEDASAASARQAGHDPAVAAGVSGIITQLLMLPTAAGASNLGDAYAALLEQARFVHEGLTGDKGPSLMLDPPLPGRASGSGGVLPLAWHGCLAAPALTPRGCPCPPLSLLRPLLQLLSAPLGRLSPMAAMPA